MAKDLYEILGINKNASEDEIKRSYRKLAQKHHPDRNKGDKASEDKFKEINSAYEVLSDSKKRQQYDQFGDAAFSNSGQGTPGGFDFSGFSGFGGGFADIFETFFSGGQSSSRGRNQEIHGDDREAEVSITFEEAAFGVEKEIKVNKVGECEICKGKGATPGSKIIACPTCHGAGEIKAVKNTILGQMVTRRVCSDCSGVGKKPEKACTSCSGAGRVRLAERLTVRIPAGIQDDSTIRLAGKGDSGRLGGSAGDLYIHVTIHPHKLYSRKNSDVYSTQEISLVQAVLGDEVLVKTLHGQVAMRIPAGTESGKVFFLKGYGVQKLKSSGKGDHFVTIIVKVPTKLSKKEKELYQQLAKESGINIKEEKGFFRKVMGE